MRYFDSHAHYNDERFDEEYPGGRVQAIADARAAGVEAILNAGTDPLSSAASVALAEQYPFFYASAGIHPGDSRRITDEEIPAALDAIRRIAAHPKCVAIGEIGLDYHYEDIPREIQLQAFRMQMELARELNLPVIVHEREAHEDGMNVVRDFSDVTGVFHCYSGSAEMARQLVDKGWYIGFTGVLTFKNARKAIEVAASIPMDRIVIETDCPYMAPDPFRGKRNDPGKIYRMAEKLAEIRGLTVEEVQRITTENGKRLYRI